MLSLTFRHSAVIIPILFILQLFAELPELRAQSKTERIDINDLYLYDLAKIDGLNRIPRTGVPGFFTIGFQLSFLTRENAPNFSDEGQCLHAEPGIYLARRKNPFSRIKLGFSLPFSYMVFNSTDVIKLSPHLLIGFRLSRKVLLDIGFGPSLWIVGDHYYGGVVSGGVFIPYVNPNEIPSGSNSGFEYGFQFRRMLKKDRRFSLVFGFSKEKISQGFSSSNFKFGIAL